MACAEKNNVGKNPVMLRMLAACLYGLRLRKKPIITMVRTGHTMLTMRRNVFYNLWPLVLDGWT